MAKVNANDTVTLPAIAVVDLLVALNDARARIQKAGEHIYAFWPTAPITGLLASGESILKLHTDYISEKTGLNEEGWIECPSSDSQTNSKKKQPKGTRSRKRTTSKRA